VSLPAGGLVVVSAGLGLAGGGSAAAGRLMAVCARDYCVARSLAFAIYHLGCADEAIRGLPVKHFDGRRGALALALFRLQARQRDHAFFFDHPGPARIQVLFPRGFRARYGVFAHGIEVWRPLSWDRARALREADLLLTNSQCTRQQAVTMGNALDRAEVLPLALEERALEGEPDAALLARVGSGFLLIVGRLAASERYKGHEALIEVLASLRATGTFARLVVIGEGDDRARLEALAKSHGLSEAVTFTGFVSEATRAALYDRCLAFVMPSDGEGFGLVYLEAMRASRACVALAGTAAAEIVVDGETGLLPVSRGEPLRAALLRLLSEPGLADRLGAAGRRRWQELFSIERFALEFGRHLDRLRGAA
jgi:phosphatidylinositol alpha-1,6-mannosyltransferase